MRLLLSVLLVAGCLRQAEHRAEHDLEVGHAEVGDVSWEVIGGLGHFRQADAGVLEIWAGAPDIQLVAEPGSAATEVWTIAVHNIMVDAELTGTGAEITEIERPRPTASVWQVVLSPGSRAELRVAPPDADQPGRFRVAVMGDIQTALDRVHEVFDRIEAEPGIRFIASNGDLVEDGEIGEYELLEEQYRTMALPYYSTIGNHELFSNPSRWSERFGRFNYHFAFKGARFSLIDSASASIDPLVYEWLDEWMAAAGDDPHLFLTHFPPLDPIGVRSGSFRSRKEASKLLSRLARGGVDVTLYGHIHSYYEFENAGIPARISGGGGAWPELFDGIDRHFLVLEIDATSGGILSIDVIRVDE